MGGKNKAPDPPDYTPLAQASQKSADYAYALAQRQQDWAEKVYNENKDVSDEVIRKSIAALDQQTADAARDRARYEQIFQPLETDYAAKAKDYASPERMETEAGKAEADVAAQFEQARQAAQDRLETYGVDPSSTRAGALDLGTRIAEAAAKSSAGNQARTQTEMIGNDMISRAIDIGRGYPGQIATNMQGAGQSGNQAVNTGLAQTASGAQTMGTGGGWQGLGNNAIGTWGNVLNQGYNNELAQFNANQQASSGWGSALGLVGGIASKFIKPFAEGGVIPPEASPSGGQVTDDIVAESGPGTPPVRVNAGEFIIPRDVVEWEGEKGIQKLIAKSRKEMQGGNGERPAQPQQAQPQGALPMPGQPVRGEGGAPIPPEGVGAIPMR